MHFGIMHMWSITRSKANHKDGRVETADSWAAAQSKRAGVVPAEWDPGEQLDWLRAAADNHEVNYDVKILGESTAEYTLTHGSSLFSTSTAGEIRCIPLQLLYVEHKVLLNGLYLWMLLWYQWRQGFPELFIGDIALNGHSPGNGIEKMRLFCGRALGGLPGHMQ